MENELERALTVREETKVSVDFVVARSNTTQQIMKRLMRENEHYYKVFGSEKFALGKSGSEKLLSGFRLGVDPVVEDLSTQDFFRFRVLTKIFDYGTGQHIGTGVGECSSNEEKYKWRAALCDEEFELTPEDRRRTKFKRGKGGTTYKVKQVRTEAADQANTILKMAKKRSQIDGTLTATGASDVFTQDEDWTGFELDNGNKTSPPMEPPKSKSDKKPNDGQAKPGQIKAIQTLVNEIYEGAPPNVQHAGVAGILEIDTLESYKDLTFNQASKAIKILNEEKDKQ